MSKALLPVGILGGTFDPIHNAHLRLAEDARVQVGLESVLLIPAGRPPHRSAPRAANHHRLAMVRLAAADRTFLRVDDGEIMSHEPSYTVTTLRRLRAEYGPQRPLVLLLGADAFMGLSVWHQWRDLFGLAHIAVATRPGHDISPSAMTAELRDEWLRRFHAGPGCLGTAPAGAIILFAMTPMDISATAIRAALARGELPRDLLPEPVLDYIAHNQLYKSLS